MPSHRSKESGEAAGTMVDFIGKCVAKSSGKYASATID